MLMFFSAVAAHKHCFILNTCNSRSVGWKLCHIKIFVIFMCVHVSVCLCGHMHVGPARPSKQEGIGHCAPVVPIQEEVTWPACLARWHSAQSGLTAWPAWGREGQGDDVHRNTHTAPFHKALLCILYLAFLKDPQPDFVCHRSSSSHAFSFLHRLLWSFAILCFAVYNPLFLSFLSPSPTFGQRFNIKDLQLNDMETLPEHFL